MARISQKDEDFCISLLTEWGNWQQTKMAVNCLTFPSKSTEARALEGRGGGKPGALIPNIDCPPRVTKVNSAVSGLMDKRVDNLLYWIYIYAYPPNGHPTHDQKERIAMMKGKYKRSTFCVLRKRIYTAILDKFRIAA